ncbi:hypothetical protein V0288_25140 [Pannus brasiliensis CCIBt3594]|uniref:Uncharacterized protein n=1 Tax=Pannus brasiliensis CCIBt3594 TaxID=1427578 RepID=A0AAW9QRK0_9CHRO
MTIDSRLPRPGLSKKLTFGSLAWTRARDSTPVARLALFDHYGVGYGWNHQRKHLPDKSFTRIEGRHAPNERNC